ncbi:hypothetical protein MMC30_007156 [Trapelia coarctata]|nr:hypothetical protein [Trapelia coarctata]
MGSWNTYGPLCFSWMLSSMVYINVVPVLAGSWTQIGVKNITLIGPQLTPDVTNVSRDGGYSVLINENIVWLYDDTECMGYAGNQLSFVSNTAALSYPNQNISTVDDFGVVEVGADGYGRRETAILANDTVGTGGWIPFMADELQFNDGHKGNERVAIWPGTSPTPISTTQAFMYAPLVYVDYKPQDPSKEYQARGMTLIAITIPDTHKGGPVAVRKGDLVIPGNEVAFGGFATLLGHVSTADPTRDNTTRDIYLIGAAKNGLQLARVALDDALAYAKYTYFEPQNLGFSSTAPSPDITDSRKMYLPGTFTSGSVFYSPYFSTYVMIYFNRMVDSTFYIRFLDLNQPLGTDAIWTVGGKNGQGIQQEDAEALVKYTWSPEQKLYVSPTGPGGFNYAGGAHPEYFNRQYYAQSLYTDSTPFRQRRNAWYGSSLLDEADAGGDGRHLLLSWTSQIQGGLNNGIYQIWLAKVEFDSLPVKPSASSTASGASVSTPTSGPSPTDSLGPTKTCENMIPCNGGERSVTVFGHDQRKEYGFWAVIWELGLLGGVIGAAAVLF